MKFKYVWLLLLASSAQGADWSYTSQVSTIVAKQGTATAADKAASAALERDKAAALVYLPTANVSARRDQVRDKITPSTYHETSANALVSVNLFRFGADHALRDASRHRYEAALGQSALSKLEGEASAARLINDAIAAAMEVASYKRRLTIQEQMIAAAEARFRKGILSEQELTKLKLEASTLAMTTRAAERNADRTSTLVSAFGASLPQPSAWPIGTKVGSLSVAKIKEWLQKLNQNALELKNAEERALAADAAVREARGVMLPSLDASASWQRSVLNDNEPMLNQQRYYLTLTAPVFSKFSEWGEYRARSEEAAAASSTLDATRVRVTHEFTHARTAILALMDEAIERDRNIEAAERLFKDNVSRFERGLISVNDLSIDEHRVREAELTAIRTWQGLHNDLFEVAKIAGTSVMPALQHL